MPVNRWIVKLLDAGLSPDIRVLAGDIHIADLDEAERRIIAEHRVAGGALLNLCPGGKVALSTWSLPEEAVRRSAAAKRGKPRSAETRAKLAAANRGKTATPESIAKRVAATKGRKQSAEWVAKRMAAVAETKAAKPRSTHCTNGHEWTPATTCEAKRGRNCRTCTNERARRDRLAGKRKYVPRPYRPKVRVRDRVLSSLPVGKDFRWLDIVPIAPGMTERAIGTMLSRAAQDGLVVRVRRGVYRRQALLTPEPLL